MDGHVIIFTLYLSYRAFNSDSLTQYVQKVVASNTKCHAMCGSHRLLPSGDFADGFGSRHCTGGESGLAHRISALPVAGRAKTAIANRS